MWKWWKHIQGKCIDFYKTLSVLPAKLHGNYFYSVLAINLFFTTILVQKQQYE